MHTPGQRYWFRAKRFGWGWGLPTCWQGWLVLAVYFGSFALGIAWLKHQARPAEFIAFVSAITLPLLLILWKKGEPLRWRWGGD